ncbi:hypothetical protein Lfu02_13550 [Longispora fulva]|uniref:Choice-of-anchor D domain-containing protein n=1 Tax=Longispora fulva TaxID=619741 RepID=A0A8J7GP34_9ACTN|nr:hypothetical protein [Longispora fulva]MBG6140633.1 hypothetical protein [Longispora fulva]GIG56983.1 hypothetical protein Lfu02_13550 [Longispora fulva]
MLLTAGPALAAPPAAPYNFLSISEAGRNVVVSTSNSVSVSNGVSVQPVGDGITYVTVTPPSGQKFHVGAYQTLQTADDTRAGLDVVQHEWGCGQSNTAGTLNIGEVKYDGDGRLSAIAASYNYDCRGGLAGEVRWNSTIGYRTTSASTGELSWGGTENGQLSPAQRITLTGQGPQPTHFGAAALTGAQATSFQVTAEDCKGRDLGYGQTCFVEVAFRPKAKGAATATVELTNDTQAGRVVVSLRGEGFVPARGTYYPVTPTRILDTRNGGGTYGPGSVHNLQITGQAGLPASGVSAVVVNLTVVDPSAPSFITAYPKGIVRPQVSSLNFAAGWTGANSVTVPVGADGQISLYQHGGQAHVLVDVLGFYAGSNEVLATRGLGSDYLPVKVERLFDSREDLKRPVPGGYQVTVPVAYTDLTEHITALALSITAVDPTGPGYFTAWSGDGPRPQTSTLNFAAHHTVPNMAIVPTSNCAPQWSCLPTTRVTIHNFGSDAHMIVDIVGIYVDANLERGLRFNPVQPVRITDTREGLGAGQLGPQTITTIQAPPSVAGTNTIALSANVTAVNSTASTFLTLWPALNGDPARPTASNLNPAPGQTVAVATITEIGETNKFNVYHHAGWSHLLVDVNGTFEIPWYKTLAVKGGAGGRSVSAVPGRQAPALSGDRPQSVLAAG